MDFWFLGEKTLVEGVLAEYGTFKGLQMKSRKTTCHKSGCVCVKTSALEEDGVQLAVSS